MRKILFALRDIPDDPDCGLYLDTFRKRGFTIVTARQESLLLRADAVLVYGNGKELSQEEREYLALAAGRNIPAVCIRYDSFTEDMKDILSSAEVLDAGRISFEQLSSLISERQQDIYAAKEEVRKGGRWINFLFLVMTALLVFFLLFKITQFSAEREEQLTDEEERISQLVRSAVVKVYSVGTMNEESWRGSGFAVSRDGWIVTNAHVVDHAAVSYKVVYREQVYNAEVAAVSDEQDIALVRVDAVLHNTLVFEEEKPRQGDTLYAVGYPGSQKLTVVTGTYEGTVSAMSGTRYTGIRMPLKAGISGSPVVNEHGRVTGIASAVSRTDENEAWMVDGQDVKDFLKDYIFLQD